MEGSVGIDVDVKCFIVGRCVNEAYFARLEEIVGGDKVFLVRSDFEVMRANSGLVFVGVIEALHVIKVRYIKSGDVVCGC